MADPGVQAKKLVSLQPLRVRVLHLAISSMFLTVILLSTLYLFNPPLDFQDFLRIVQQVLPIFIGFLLAAVSYATGTKESGSIELERFDMLRLILNCSFGFYWVGVVALTSIFFYSHSHLAEAGSGMAKDIFFGVLTILLSVITGVAGAIATKIFIEEYKPSTLPAKPASPDGQL